MSATFDGVIALDGPSGTGKSTVARRLAERLGVRYLDTGAMYRGLTFAVLQAGADPSDDAAVLTVLKRIRLEVSTAPAGVPRVRLDGVGVDTEIRSAAVTGNVSAVAAIPAVRTALVAEQRRLIGAGGIVVEGRDIGAVVWPQARPKVFLTASADARASRRAGESAGTPVADIAADLARRDGLDSSRAASPMSKADDALEIDTTAMSVDEVIERLVDLVDLVDIGDAVGVAGETAARADPAVREDRRCD